MLFKLKRLVVAGSLLCLTAVCEAVPEQQLTSMMPAQIQKFWQQQVKTGSLTTPDGQQLPYAFVMPADPQYAVILIQGRTEAYLKYQELFFDMAAKHVAVFSLDHRGQGLSPRPLADRHKGHITDFALYSQDQRQFVAEVVQPRTGALPLNVLAHSMGGAVAVQLLATAPELFNRAVLTSPMIAPNAQVAFSEQDGCYLATALGWSCPDCYAGFVSQPYPADQAFGDNILTSSPERYRLFRALFREQPELQLGGPTWSWLSQACDVADRMPAYAKQIKLPVLILQSGADRAVSNLAQQQFCADLGLWCSSGQVQQFPGAKHELLFESDKFRDDAVQKILSFYATPVAQLK